MSRTRAGPNLEEDTPAREYSSFYDSCEGESHEDDFVDHLACRLCVDRAAAMLILTKSLVAVRFAHRAGAAKE